MIHYYIAIADYVDDMMELAFQMDKEQTEVRVPSPLASQYERPENLEEAKKAYASRFSF